MGCVQRFFISPEDHPSDIFIGDSESTSSISELFLAYGKLESTCQNLAVGVHTLCASFERLVSPLLSRTSLPTRDQPDEEGSS